MLKVILMFLFFFSINISYSDSVTIQSTTSTRDSGLYKYLLPLYPNYDQVKLRLSLLVQVKQLLMQEIVTATS